MTTKHALSGAFRSKVGASAYSHALAARKRAAFARVSCDTPPVVSFDQRALSVGNEPARAGRGALDYLPTGKSLCWPTRAVFACLEHAEHKAPKTGVGWGHPPSSSRVIKFAGRSSAEESAEKRGVSPAPRRTQNTAATPRAQHCERSP